MWVQGHFQRTHQKNYKENLKIFYICFIFITCNLWIDLHLQYSIMGILKHWSSKAFLFFLLCYVLFIQLNHLSVLVKSFIRITACSAATITALYNLFVIIVKSITIYSLSITYYWLFKIKIWKILYL